MVSEDSVQGFLFRVGLLLKNYHLACCGKEVAYSLDFISRLFSTEGMIAEALNAALLVWKNRKEVGEEEPSPYIITGRPMSQNSFFSQGISLQTFSY